MNSHSLQGLQRCLFKKILGSLKLRFFVSSDVMVEGVETLEGQNLGHTLRDCLKGQSNHRLSDK